MSEEFIIELAQLTVKTIGLMAMPIIIAIVVVGLLSNILQTVTQIRDPALGFVPKVVAAGVVLVLATPWLLQVIQRYTESIFALAAGAAPG